MEALRAQCYPTSTVEMVHDSVPNSSKKISECVQSGGIVNSKIVLGHASAMTEKSEEN